MRVFVKICGITSPEAARACEDSSVDAIGFVFASSSRRVDAREAGIIGSQVRSPMARVGVFVNEEPEEMLRVARAAGLTHVQLHGLEPPAVCQHMKRCGYGVIKAFRVRSREDLLETRRYEVDAILLDAFVPGVEGGTGSRLDLDLLDGFTSEKKVIIAGGLKEENVGEVIRRVRPFGVDVSSGVEVFGHKSPDLIFRFASAVRVAEKEGSQS